MKLQGYIIIFLMALVYTTSGAQDVLVRAMLDTNKALIGDQIKLHLRVEKPSSGWKVLFPALKDTITGKIEIIKVSPVDTTAEKPGRQLLNQDIIITVFDTGFFEIPSLPFIVRLGERTDTLNTLPVGFEVLSVKTGHEIRDIKAIYKVPISLREIAPYLLLLVAVGLLVWLLIRYVNNRKNGISRTENRMISDRTTLT